MVSSLKIEMKKAGDLLEQGMFIWQGRMYVVLKRRDAENFLQVWNVASGWTNNPDNRWQFALPIVDDGESIFCNLKNGEIQIERFNGYCEVEALMYEPKHSV